MNFNLFDPTQWADPSGLIILIVAIVVTLLMTMVHYIDGAWDDWLDEPCGRGSIKDWWLLNGSDVRTSVTSNIEPKADE